MKTTIRKEERYYIKNLQAKEFIEKLALITQPKLFPNSYNQTLYFNNSEHEVPFEISIKARKYTFSPLGEHLKLTPDEEWIFEIKRDLVRKNSRLRQKERKNLKLDEILKILQNKIKNVIITSPLQPYVADNYRRKHYVINGKDKFRITIDDKLKYYLFKSKFNATQIGKENYSRVEIKVPQNELNSPEFHKIKKLLQKSGAEPVVSKKDTAYNVLSEYLRNKYNRNIKPSNIEIEAKLSLSGRDQYVFHKIKNDFYNGVFKEFKVVKDFSYTLEGGKLHRYIITPDNHYLRISMKGESKKAIYKGDSEVVTDPFGLNCII